MHKLISQQLAEATRTTTGELDVDKLVELVGAAYDEADRDRQWLLDAFDLIPEGIAIFDKNDRHVLWNRHYAEIYAKSQTALVAGSSFEDTLRTGLANGQYPIAIGREEEWLAARLARHRQVSNTEFQHLANGRWVRVEERRTAEGGSIGIRIDITELKQREESFRLLFEDNPLPMLVCEHTALKFLAVNEAAIKHYGYSREQFLAMTVFDLRAPDNRQDLQERLASGKPVRIMGARRQHVRADGSLIDVEIYSRHLKYEGEYASLFTVIDFTARKRAEDELRETREFLNTIIDNVPVAVTVKDAGDFRYKLVNRAAETFLGMPREEIIGKSAHAIFSKESADAIVERDRKLLETGSEFVLGELPYHSANNGISHINTRRLVVRDENGTPRYLVGVVEDVTERKRAEDELRETREFLNTIIDNVPVAVTVKDAATFRYLLVNQAAENFMGMPREQIVGKSPHELFPKAAADGIAERDKKLLEGGTEIVLDDRPFHSDTNGIRNINTRRRAVCDASGKPRYLLGVVEDITELKRTEGKLRETREFLDTIIDNVPVAVNVKDARDFRYLLINQAAERFMGLTREQVIGKSVHELYPQDVADAITARDCALLVNGAEVVLGERPIHADASGIRNVNTRRLTVCDETGSPRFLLGVVEDITELKTAEERIAHLANHDSLTDLPNRAAFDRHLQQMLDQSAVSGTEFAVIYLDLDRFKGINDVFGHGAGDHVLQETARRMKAAAGADAFLARLGGDEFTLTVPGNPDTAEELAAALQAAMAHPIEAESHRFTVGLSIGIALYPSDGADAKTLLSNADAALYRAKADGRGMVRFFEAEMDRQVRERRAMTHELRSAVTNGELTLHYQPQATIDSRIIGFEVLARWTHPKLGSVPPTTFIPLAEDSGIIIAMGEWILREACRQAVSWKHPLNIAVNLSPVQFQHGDLPGIVHTILLETGLAPHRLELEITEGVLMHDFSHAVSVLRRLKALGVRIAMDDFGTGYSSLSYLQSFPFDKIKIDKSFISSLGRSPQSQTIIRAVIGLGRGLGLPVAAEGVETREQLEFLIQEACSEIQGYLIGRPEVIEAYAGVVGGTAKPVAIKQAG